jgi:hypothetical protein
VLAETLRLGSPPGGLVALLLSVVESSTGSLDAASSYLCAMSGSGWVTLLVLAPCSGTLVLLDGPARAGEILWERVLPNRLNVLSAETVLGLAPVKH